jgi:ribosome-interacting GTPase 1
MMEFEDIQIQLVDMPPIAPEMTEPWVVAIARAADAVVLVLDASSGTILDDMEAFQSEIAHSKLHLIAPGAGPTGDHPIGTIFRPAIIAANRIDVPGAREDLDVFMELYQPDLPVIPISTATGDGLEDLKIRIWELLGIVRVYTKIPGKPADRNRPFTMKRGSTVADLATTVHKEFAGRLRFARAWGKGKPDGVMIGREQELEDGDIVELHV